jgi:uncharacterized protein YihD (DUF1040 family)
MSKSRTSLFSGFDQNIKDIILHMVIIQLIIYNWFNNAYMAGIKNNTEEHINR